MQAPVSKTRALHEVNQDTEKDSLDFKMRQNRDDELIKYILDFEKKYGPNSRNKPTLDEYDEYKDALTRARVSTSLLSILH